MGTDKWGPATWTLFHTLAANVADTAFTDETGLGDKLVGIIVDICRHLPCPECAKHAGIFWDVQLRVHPIRSKRDLENTLYVLHNSVNARLHRPLFRYDHLPVYRGTEGTGTGATRVVAAFAQFSAHFHTKGDMKLLAESFHRKQCFNRVHQWVSAHIRLFV